MPDNQMPITELQGAKTVPFDKIYLDPNNPRIAPEDPPGYPVRVNKVERRRAIVAHSVNSARSRVDLRPSAGRCRSSQQSAAARPAACR